MATIMAQPGRMTFKLNAGTAEDDKTLYKNVSLAGIKGSADADGLAPVAVAVSGLLSMDVELITLQRNEFLVL